jgi:hypothetical protein
MRASPHRPEQIPLTGPLTPLLQLPSEALNTLQVLVLPPAGMAVHVAPGDVTEQKSVLLPVDPTEHSDVPPELEVHEFPLAGVLFRTEQLLPPAVPLAEQNIPALAVRELHSLLLPPMAEHARLVPPLVELVEHE